MNIAPQYQQVKTAPSLPRDGITGFAAPKPQKRFVIRNNTIEEMQDDDDEPDYVMTSPNATYGPHLNLIPMFQNAQVPRLFYGSRFFNQALPLVNGEQAWVQNLDDGDPDGRSFDDIMGEKAGAVRAQQNGEVTDVQPNHVKVRYEDGSEVAHKIYDRFLFNRKSSLNSTPLVKTGDKVSKRQVLAHSNYTDKNGILALGVNARVGVAAYNGFTMDDAIVISEPFAKRISAKTTYTEGKSYDNEVKGGLGHYTSVFPTKYKKNQLQSMDDDGVILPGTKVSKGDPLILATRPKSITSSAAHLGKFTRGFRQMRSDASSTWDHEDDGVVTDVARTKSGDVKVVVESINPARVGDKIVQRAGNKGTVSLILPEDQMPRTADGKPLEILMNQQGIPSRANCAQPYEIALAKVAEKLGKPMVLSAFTKDGEFRYDMVEKILKENNVNPYEEVFDPKINRKLDQPILVGNMYTMKLHHTSEGKISGRGQGSYDQNQQPSKGSGEGGQSKRMSNLETAALRSSGAYHNQFEGSVLRGQENGNYWREYRAGGRPQTPGRPFVFDKYMSMLNGAGMHARDMGGGVLRLGPMTDKILDSHKPVDIENGELVDLNTLEPVKGGLFDPALVAANKMGRVPLPFAMPNPSTEKYVRQLLGLTEKELREIMAGRQHLPEHLMPKKK